MDNNWIDDEKEAYIKLFILLAIIFGTIFFIFFKFETSNDYYNRKLAEDQYTGIIVKKFIDSKNHNNPTIIFQDGNVQTRLNFRWINYYDSCNINDLIIKEKGKRILYVIRANKKDTLNLEFDRNGIKTGDIILRHDANKAKMKK